MKVFGSLAVILGVTCGIASAGPLANGGNNSSCEAQCRAKIQKFNYVPGSSYSYKYTTRTETALEQTSDQKSTIYLDADVSLHVLDNCRYALKVDSIELEEEVSGTSRRRSPGAKELAESLTKNPLVFHYDSGIVSKLCPAVGESKSTLNIKRGMLSMIQNSMAEFDMNDIAFEKDVFGRCLTTYNAMEDWSGQWTIFKRKSLSNCRSDRRVVNVMAMPSHVGKSSSMINGTQECTQIVKDSIIQSVECRERHVVKPFSRQKKGAATEVQTILKFQRVNATPKTLTLSYPEAEGRSMKYDSDADPEIEISRMENQAKNMLQRLSREEVADIKETNNEFTKLVELIRKMPYNSLKSLSSQFKGNQKFIDAIISTMTKDSMKLIAELIKEKLISTRDAKIWLVRAALATDVELSGIATMMEIMDVEDIVVEAHLAVSAMARTYIEENPSKIPEVIENLVARLYSDLGSGSEDRMLAKIKAIGNLGMSTGKENALLQQKQNIRVRLAAVEAFRRFPCKKVDREPLMKIFSSGSEDIEVRVAAYLNSIKCLDRKMIETVRKTLLDESQNSHLTTFVFTHIKNLEKRISIRQDFSSITSDETLKSLELDAMNFSKNYFYEMFFNPLDIGFEIDAGSIMSPTGFQSFMLNTTFDLFGRKVNLFDSRVRLSRDMSSLDGFIRFFGREVFYKNVITKDISEMDSLMKAVMSPNGLKFTRSMMVLDVETIIPTGTGLPLTVAVNATATLAMDLKAMPPQNMKGSNFVAEARSAPSLALQFGVSMMVEAPRTTSGIKMIVTGSSEWEITGRINMDLSDSRMVRNIQISTPRDRSDIIDIQSDIYIIGAGAEREIVSSGARPKHWEMCSGEYTHTILGHKACLDATYPVATSTDVPFFLLRGPSRFNFRWMKTDKSLKTFEVASNFIYGPREILELSFSMNTPGSEVDRHFKGRAYSDFQNNKLGIDLISPMKKASIEAVYDLEPSNNKIQVSAKLDGKTELSLNGGMEVVNGRVMIMSPFLEMFVRDKQVLLVKSQIASHGTQKYNGDMEIHSVFNKDKPIKMMAEYSTVNQRQRMFFNLNSEYMTSNVESTVIHDGQKWNIVAEGDYSFNKGSPQKFSMNSEMTDDVHNVVVKGNLKKNGAEVLTGEAKMVRGGPLNFNASFALLEGHIKGALGLSIEGRNTVVTAKASRAGEEYSTSMKFRMIPTSTSFVAKFQLPQGVESKAQFEYDLDSSVKRLVAETDLYGKLYSARVSYVPSENLHKLNGKVKFANENWQIAAALGTDPIYQTKVDITQNRVKILSTLFGVSKDMSKPSMKVFIEIREKSLLDLSTDAIIERRRVSLSTTMRAPYELEANAGLKCSGTLAQTMKLEAEIEARNHDRTIDVGLKSTAEIALWQRNNKINIETTIRRPHGSTTLELKNMLDPSSWSIEWRLRKPQEQEHKVLSSGTYNLSPSNLQLRGVFEMNMRMLGHELVVEPVSMNTAMSVDRHEMKMKSEISKNSGSSLAMVSMQLSNSQVQKGLVVDVTVMGNKIHVKSLLEGNNLIDGWKATFDGKWNEREVLVLGGLQMSSTNWIANLKLDSSVAVIPSAQIGFSMNPVSGSAKSVKAYYEFKEHLANVEMIVDANSLDAVVKTSLENWKHTDVKATWELQRRKHLVVNFSTTKYPNNKLEIEVDNAWKKAEGRLIIPQIYNGNLIDGSLTYENGKGKLNVMFRGQQKAKMLFELRNEINAKSLSVAAAYDINNVANHFNFEADFKRPNPTHYEAKVSLQKDAKEIFDFTYKGTLNTVDGFTLGNQIEAETTLPWTWPKIFIQSTMIFKSDNIRVQYKVGPSSNDVYYSAEMIGQLKNEPNVFSLDGRLDGQWGRMMKGSYQASMKTDRERNLEFGVKAESDSKIVLSTQWRATYSDRRIELNADWQMPKFHQNAVLESMIGFEEDTFVIGMKVDRKQGDVHNPEFALRIPLKISDVKGIVWLRVPKELGGQTLLTNLITTRSSVDFDLDYSSNDQIISAKAGSKWDQGISMNGKLERNGKNVIKTDLTASWRIPQVFNVKLQAMYRDASYNIELNGQKTGTTGKVSMEAESNRWQAKHFVRGFYSTESKTAQLKAEIVDLKVNIDAKMISGVFTLDSDAQLRAEKMGELKISFDSNTKKGSLDASWNGKRISTSFVAQIVDGEWKMDLPNGSSSLTWSLDHQKQMSVRGHWTFQSQNWRIEISTDPSVFYKTEAAVYFKNEQVAQLQIQLELANILLKFHATHNGLTHSIEFSGQMQPNSMNFLFVMDCPWLGHIDSKFSSKDTLSTFEFSTESNVFSQVYALEIKGEVEKNRGTGTFKMQCPHHGPSHGRFEGSIEGDKISAVFTSDKLPKPIEASLEMTRDDVRFTLKSSKVDIEGNLFYNGPKYGLRMTEKKLDQTYEATATLVFGKEYEVVLQTPRIARSRLNLVLSVSADYYANYRITGEWLGRQVLDLLWEGEELVMFFDGKIKANFDFSDKLGKHTMEIDYNLLQEKPSVIVHFDGKEIVVASSETGAHKLRLDWQDTKVEVEYSSNKDGLKNSIQVSKEGKSFGYRLNVAQDKVKSSLRIWSSRRTILIELKEDLNGIHGLLAWDHERDPQKRIEVMFFTENLRGVEEQRVLTVSIPALNEEIVIREVDEKHPLWNLDQGERSPRMSVLMTKEGKVRMYAGNLMVRAEMSSAKSELAVKRLSRQEDDFNMGYDMQGDAMSAQFHWSPELPASYQRALKGMLNEIQKNS